MSKAPLKPCAKVGCRELVRGVRYCKAHTRDESARVQSQDRGYNERWKLIRRLYVQKHPLCEVCMAPVEIVHHKTPIAEGGERYNYDNLQSLCRVCHGKAHGGGGSIC